uniref:Uncharacterized protein n=1 Tax=Sphaerodactylus townsendi TaxID=933632 RepID=A0ACB8FYM0_9SAUR
MLGEAIFKYQGEDSIRSSEDDAGNSLATAAGCQHRLEEPNGLGAFFITPYHTTERQECSDFKDCRVNSSSIYDSGMIGKESRKAPSTTRSSTVSEAKSPKDVNS